MGRIGEPAKDAVPALIQALGDEYSGVRRDAAEALRRIGGPAVSALKQALEDENSEVREGATKALAYIRRKSAESYVSSSTASDRRDSRDYDSYASSGWNDMGGEGGYGRPD